MDITFEKATDAAIALTPEEEAALARLKVLELVNGYDFEWCRTILEQDPFKQRIQQENITLVRNILKSKQGEFFGYHVDIQGERLEILVDYMSAEFRRSKGTSGYYSKEFSMLESGICVCCAEYMHAAFSELESKAGNRFVKKAFVAAQHHVLQTLREVTMQNAMEEMFNNLSSELERLGISVLYL